MRSFPLAFVLLICAAHAHGQATLTKGTNFSVDVAKDGRIAMDLLGQVWTLPAAGGVAQPVTSAEHNARQPRWSPDATAIVYQGRSGDREQLWLLRMQDASLQNISDGHFFDLQPSWHPGGERIVYASDRRDAGFDLWELDIETRLTWRISDLPGDETAPAWSSDGRDLAYVHRLDDNWSLMLRRHGRPDRVLVTLPTPISAPAWRPDGSLITFLRQGDTGLSIDMAILSDPVLVRPWVTGEDIFPGPVAWIDRHQLLYAADGHIRSRQFDAWKASTIPFQATVHREDEARPTAILQRELPVVDEPTGQLVIRTERLFDGIGGGYREGLDIVIEGSRIVAVDERRERPGAIVIDLGNLTTLPGYIDGHASLPDDPDESLGPVLLSFGVTSVVADNGGVEQLNRVWSGKEMPGPRVLGADWLLQLDSISTTLPGPASLPVSPRGITYEDIKFANGSDARTVFSALADARTQGVNNLLRSRQAALLGGSPTTIRRFTEKPSLDDQSAAIVLGSAGNGFPPGAALHAEFLALADAGLDEETILRTAGINAAQALGLGLQTGRIAPGASADLVLVDGDPLNDIRDTLNVVGIVRNGRFFSAIGLIERVE